MIQWPLIPEIEDGMPFSALHHNLYGEALNYLLGISHARYSLWRLHEQYGWWETGHTNWQTLWEGWLWYTGQPDLIYRAELYNEGAYTTTAQLQVYSGTWQDLGDAISAEGTDNSLRTGTIDVSGQGWADGRVRLRYRVRSSNSAGTPRHNTGGLAFWFLRGERYTCDNRPFRSTRARCRELESTTTSIEDSLSPRAANRSEAAKQATRPKTSGGSSSLKARRGRANRT